LLTAERRLGVAADDVLADLLARQRAALLAVLGPHQAGRLLHRAVAAVAVDRIPAAEEHARSEESSVSLHRTCQTTTHSEKHRPVAGSIDIS